MSAPATSATLSPSELHNQLAAMSSGGAGPLVPTFHGFVKDSIDGLTLFEACLSGKLHHVPRRPHDRERSSLIRSGSVFIYEENASGIKRWTDGVAWSPSRILGNFLIYRELEKPFPPGEKKRAMKRKRSSLPGEPYPRRDSDDNDAEQVTPISPAHTNTGEVKSSSSELPSSENDKDLERMLIGSLVDSYGFRPDGLIKKTMSISINGISHHMVSYYKMDDVKKGLLPGPRNDPRLQGLVVRQDLYLKQNFRAPVEDAEQFAVGGQMNPHPQMIYAMQTPYGVRPGQYIGGQQYGTVYAVPGSTGNTYGAVAAPSWPGHQGTAGAAGYGSTHPYGNQGYAGYQNRTPSTAARSEDSNPPTYGSQYHPPYPSMQRNGSQPSPSIAGSAYQTPIQPQSSTFGNMSARPSYSGNSMTSPATNGQAQSAYGTSAQQYPVRSPSQGYPMQSAPNSAVSPHTGVKSPSTAAPASAPAADMSYRSASYSGPSAHTGGDASGLGISGNSYPSQPPQSTSYSAYGASGQAYRSGDLPLATAAGAPYDQ